MKEILCRVLIALLNMSLLSDCGKTSSSQAPENQEIRVSKPEISESIEGESRIVQETETGKDGSDVEFAVIFGALEDGGYNDEVYKGCQMAVEKSGHSSDHAETRDVPEVEIQIQSYTDIGDYDVIISINTDQVDALEMVAKEYPDQKFRMLNTTIDDHDNTNYLAAAYLNQHSLSGALAGLATKDDRFPLSNPGNILGLCIAMGTPTSRGQTVGFITGVKYANLDAEVLTNYIGGYGDPAIAEELALVMYGGGADIVSVSAGSSAQGIFHAAKGEDRYVIGTLLAMADPKHGLSTSYKKIWLLVIGEIQMLVDRIWMSDSKTVGIPEGICDYDVEGLNVQISDDIMKILGDTRQLIVDGKLVLLTDIGRAEGWAKENRLNP